MKQGNCPAQTTFWREGTLCALLTIMSFGASAQNASAEQFRIGMAAPLSGPFAILGNQLVEGARNAALIPDSVTPDLVIADDSCSAEGGKAAAQTFIQAQVQIATGFLCTEALEAALPVLAERSIPVLTSGVREVTLTEKRTSALPAVFRLTTGLDKQAEAAGNTLGSLWRNEAFAVIDDGTIEGRELSGRVLAHLKEKQLQPVFADTYRPGLDNQNALIGRLKRAGATHVFVGGQRDDISAIARSAQTMKYPLTIAGGDMLQAGQGAQDLAEGILMIAVPEAETLATAQAAVDAIQTAGQLAEGYTIAGFASIQIAADTLKASAEQKQTPQNILSTKPFETALGTIKFDGNGQRTDNPNRLQRYDGKRFVVVDN